MKKQEKQEKKWSCGDCQYNDGGTCEKTQRQIDICAAACKKFKLFYDLQE